jgi:hypothetical protein
MFDSGNVGFSGTRLTYERDDRPQGVYPTTFSLAIIKLLSGVYLDHHLFWPMGVGRTPFFYPTPVVSLHLVSGCTCFGMVD